MMRCTAKPQIPHNKINGVRVFDFSCMTLRIRSVVLKSKTLTPLILNALFCKIWMIRGAYVSTAGLLTYLISRFPRKRESRQTKHQKDSSFCGNGNQFISFPCSAWECICKLSLCSVTSKTKFLKSKALIPSFDIRQIISYLVFILGLICFTLTFSSKADAGEVSIAVAANFAGTIKTLQPQFEQQSGHKITLHIGSTGKLYAQIVNGAPFDVFLAADKKRPEKLELDGKTVAGSRFTYANGVLVLWAPKAAKLSSTVEKLYTANKLTRLSITNPKLAPYGMAAKQFLLSTNRWYEYQDMVVQGNNISQTFQFVESGGVDAGFIALAQIASQQRSLATIWEIPAASYTPLEQQAVLLKRGGDNPAAESFMQFLKTDEVKEQIKQTGYSLKVGGGKINTGFK